MECKLHFADVVDHRGLFNEKTIDAVKELVRDGVRSATKTIEMQGKAFYEWYMTRKVLPLPLLLLLPLPLLCNMLMCYVVYAGVPQDRLENAYLRPRNDNIELLMALHDVGVRKSSAQRMSVTSSSAISKIVGTDQHVAKEWLGPETRPLAEARVDSARQLAPKRAKIEAAAAKEAKKRTADRHSDSRDAFLSKRGKNAGKKESAMAYPVITSVEDLPALVTVQGQPGFPGNYDLLCVEITAWKERQYSKDLWGDGFVGGGANGLFHRFCAEAAASDVGKAEAARKIRLHLAELIRRYHSKVVPGLARGSVAATPWVR